MLTIKHGGVAVLALAAVALTLPPAGAATRVQKTFGGWRVDCTEQDDGKKGCILQYALVTQTDKRPVFSWIIAPGKAGAPNKVILRAPTGVLLPEGVNIGIEGADPVKISYLTCGPQACVAEFDMTDKWRKALGSYPKAIISYKAVTGEPIKHEIDLKQFGDAYKYYDSQLATQN